MQALNNPMMFHENILSDSTIGNALMNDVFRNDISHDNFYQTGYEPMIFNRNNAFALETVLSSVVPLEKEVIIINTGADTTKTVELCLHHDITYSIVETTSTYDNWKVIDDLMTAKGNISHIIISFSPASSITSKELMQLGKLTEKWRIGFIVNSNSKSIPINDVKRYNIDYLIGCTDHTDLQSFILARRSRLVQTEGNSRSSLYDLYGYWQKALWHRRPEIEPMAF
ncbi:hypothetical protein DMA11_09635 [Marinilabiliaceae bacterium JC017]|nr:hypothetical protein DMA11_09635 [Marinilabiliaceae bacterium JC017]